MGIHAWIAIVSFSYVSTQLALTVYSTNRPEIWASYIKFLDKDAEGGTESKIIWWSNSYTFMPFILLTL